MVFSKKINIYKNYWNTGLFALFIWSMIVGAINHSLISFLASFAFLIYFCFSIFLQNYCTSEKKIQKVYNSLIYISLFSAILGVIEKILFLGWGLSLWKWMLVLTAQPIFENRIYSTFGNPNVAGNWFGVMIILSLYFNNISGGRKKRFYFLTTILFVISIFLTGSRGAYIGELSGLSVFWFFKKNKKDILTISLICIFISVLVVIPSNILNFNYNTDQQVNKAVSNQKMQEDEEHKIHESVNSRIGIWMGSLKMIEDKPVTGWGMMTYLKPHTDYLGDDYYYSTLFHAHNIWITFTATLGGVGLLIYLYMKVNLLKSIRVLHQNHCEITSVLAAIQALIIGHGLVDFTIMAPQTGLIFIGCSAIITSLSMQYSPSLTKMPLFIKTYKSLSKSKWIN